MPPRIRTRASKALKENIEVTENKLKPVKNTNKATRKPLADKTNSASDDASLEIPLKSKKTNTKSTKTSSNKNGDIKSVAKKQKQTVKTKENAEPTNDVRPRRDRRLPNRFVENAVLSNLSNSKESPNVSLNSSTMNPKADKTPGMKDSLSKSDKPDPSPFKTPVKTDNSLLANRPRRICRLPSRLDDHSISPSKYIPIQPANASTPIQQNKLKPSVVQNKQNVGKDVELKQMVVKLTRIAKINAPQTESSDKSDKTSPDTNNNAKGRNRKKTAKSQPVNKKQSPVNNKQSSFNKNQSPIKKFLTPMSRFQTLKSPVNKLSSKKSTNNKKPEKNLSFKLLGSKKQSQENDPNDIYEFTFDPAEEPKVEKKKRKRPVTKKVAAAPKPKKSVYKSSYDQNISKALAALKNAVKSSHATQPGNLPQIAEISDEAIHNNEQNNKVNNANEVQTNNVTKETNMGFNDTGKTSVHECNYPSIRVEDIAADIDPSMEHYDNINYSPVNSPRPNMFGTSEGHQSVHHRDSPERSIHNNDPLNLLNELSDFDDQPVASSSMNMSVRHPLASPWRVEFGSLPIKWPVNTYVKPNMTPAVESSFINPEDSMKKKHIYTNMVPQTNEMFTDLDNTPTLKQPSIISFIKEMAEKSARKKRGRSVSPSKAIFQDMDVNGEANKNKKTDKKVNKASTPSKNTSEEVSSANDMSTDKENSKEERKTRKRKNDENLCNIPAKSPRKQADKDGTFFGFDDTQNENVSPVKVNNPRGRSLRPRSKVVLQEINGPSRAVLPVAAKTKIASSSEAVNRVYEGLKPAADAPVFPEKNVNDNETNIEDLSINDDSQSVHLFEDIEVVHHLKPTRKSYGKPKKVTFRQASSDSDIQEAPVPDQNESSDYDDLGDLTFEIPDVQEKKVTKKKKPKKQRTKKEEQEAEAWAANFNSMCEDIEEFPLLVE